jgi:peptidoglycan-N-acetylglucosamine deacetylase
MDRTSSHKHWVIPAIGLVIIGGLVVFGLKSSPSKTPEPVPDVPVVTSWPSAQVRKETITENPKGYEITAAYPITQSEGLTAMFRDFVTDQIEGFKTDTTEAGELPEGFRDMTLDITYEEFRNKLADNYVFLIYSDTGGAHGLQTTKTFSYDEKGNQIQLKDLFTNGAKGLGVISDYVQKELAKREFADKAWIAEGSAPTEENYQNFVIEDTGVTFIFDPYQVAPYAAGTQKVLVPASVFKTIANPKLFTVQ